MLETRPHDARTSTRIVDLFYPFPFNDFDLPCSTVGTPKPFRCVDKSKYDIFSDRF